MAISGKIVSLKDGQDLNIFPETAASAVYLENGKTLEESVITYKESDKSIVMNNPDMIQKINDMSTELDSVSSQLEQKANLNEIRNQLVMKGEQKGNFENGSVLSVLSNTDENFRPQICGYKTSLDASKYPDRDSVGLFLHNENRNPSLVCSGCTYTNNTVTIPKTYDLSDIKIGTTIETQGSPVYTGLVTNIDTSTNVITIHENWYVWNGTGTKGVPINGTNCVINQTTGIWGFNANVVLHNDTEGNKATLGEFGVLNYKPNGIAGGINVVSMGSQQIQYGFWSRATSQSPKVLHGFLGQKVMNSFSNRTDNPNDVLIRSTDINDNFDIDTNFRILNDGTLSKLKLKTQILTTNNEGINQDTGTALISSATDITINLPTVTCKYGSYITINNVNNSNVTLISDGNIIGAGINTKSLVLKPFSSITLISDKSKYFISSSSMPLGSIDCKGEIKSETSIMTTSGNIVALGENSMLKTASSSYNKGHLQLGAYHIWVDSNGRLRIHNQQPSSDTDGWIVGVQS